MSCKKRLENDNQILRAMIERWLFANEHCQPIDFYSGRMMIYTLCESFGLNPDRVYEIEEDTYRDIFDNADDVTAYLAGIFEI